MNENYFIQQKKKQLDIYFYKKVKSKNTPLNN